MADGTTLSIKRTITVRAVVTPRWKEEAERELSNALSNFDAQLAQLEQEGQQVIDQIRRQSANPLDPRVQEQVGSVQQQVAAKRAELEEQKRQVLEQQRQVREIAALGKNADQVGHGQDSWRRLLARTLDEAFWPALLARTR